MKSLLTLTLLGTLALPSLTSARIRYVDKNGGNGKYTTIQAAINAAVDADTVRILPGIYFEVITISKNILVEGGGILNTTITTTSDSTPVVITNGALQWVAVSSPSSDGVHIQNAEIRNCVIHNCTGSGIMSVGSLARASNCIVASCNVFGLYSPNGASLTATNCIIYGCGNCATEGCVSCGFGSGCGTLIARYCLEHSNGCNGFPCTTNQSSISADPGFAADGSWAIAQTSPGKDGGDPTLLDPDGSVSDIGAYGGPHTPILPYVVGPFNITLNPDGTIHFDMTGKVGY